MADENRQYQQSDDIEFLTLEFEDGDDEECEILGVFDFNGAEYIALHPVEKDDEVYLYEYSENEDSFEINDITDDELFEKVAAEFDLLDL